MNQLPANAARHVLLVALGSAGDVHPFVGIALELIRRGHTVSIASNPMFEDLIRSAGADFFPLGTVEDYHSTTENPDLWHPTKGFKLVIQFGFINPMQPVYEFIRDRYQPGKTIVAAHCLALGARIAQEHLGVPLATLHMSPAVLRSVHQMANLKGGHLPDWAPKFLKRLLYFTVDKLLIDPMLVKPVNEFRRELGLTDRVSRIMKDWWMSPESVIGIFPEFFSPLQPDWPAQLKLTSFPLYDAGGHESVPAELEAFLAAGEPPVVVTPGSANRHAQEHFATAVAACVALKRRGVLLSKFPENVPPNLPPTIRHFPYAPLSQILPRCAALVCHGGVGTIAQALAAGVPQVIMALAHDQHDNGARIARLGVGRWVDSKGFNTRFLTRALGELLDNPEVAAKCAKYKAELAGHNGIAETCDLIERLG